MSLSLGTSNYFFAFTSVVICANSTDHRDLIANMFSSQSEVHVGLDPK